jgi:hypothetical protein
VRLLIWSLLFLISTGIEEGRGASLVFVIYLVAHLYSGLFILRNWIHPGFFYSASLLIATLANFEVASKFSSGGFVRNYSYARPELFEEASLIWVFGNFVLLEAYAIKPGFRMPTLAWNLSSRNSLGFRYRVPLTVSSTFYPYWVFWYTPGWPKYFRINVCFFAP